MTLAELRARLEAIKAELRQINTDGGDADLSPEAQARWVALEAPTPGGRTLRYEL